MPIENGETLLERSNSFNGDSLNDSQINRLFTVPNTARPMSKMSDAPTFMAEQASRIRLNNETCRSLQFETLSKAFNQTND